MAIGKKKPIFFFFLFYFWHEKNKIWAPLRSINVTFWVLTRVSWTCQKKIFFLSLNISLLLSKKMQANHPHTLIKLGSIAIKTREICVSQRQKNHHSTLHVSNACPPFRTEFNAVLFPSLFLKPLKCFNCSKTEMIFLFCHNEGFCLFPE
jgi:hypothetical protein